MSEARRIDDRIEFSLKVKSAVGVLVGIGLSLIVAFALGVILGKELATPIAAAASKANPSQTEPPAQNNTEDYEIELTFHRLLIDDDRSSVNTRKAEKSGRPAAATDRSKKPQQLAQREGSTDRNETQGSQRAHEANEAQAATTTAPSSEPSTGSTKAEKTAVADNFGTPERSDIPARSDSSPANKSDSDDSSEGTEQQDRSVRADVAKAAEGAGGSDGPKSSGSPSQQADSGSAGSPSRGSGDGKDDVGTVKSRSDLAEAGGQKAESARESQIIRASEQASGKTTEERRYAVQFAATPTTDDALLLQEQLRSKGIHAYVLEVDDPERGRFYRIRAGSFPTPQAARELLDQAKAAGFEGIVMR